MQIKKVQKDNPPKQNTNKNANKIQMRTTSCQRGARSLPPRLMKWSGSSGSGLSKSMKLQKKWKSKKHRRIQLIVNYCFASPRCDGLPTSRGHHLKKWVYILVIRFCYIFIYLFIYLFVYLLVSPLDVGKPSHLGEQIVNSKQLITIFLIQRQAKHPRTGKQGSSEAGSDLAHAGQSHLL